VELPKPDSRSAAAAPGLDPDQLKLRAAHKQPGTFYSLAYDRCFERIYAGSSDYSIYLFDPAAEKPEPIGQWTRHDNYVSALVAFTTARQHWVVSGSYDRQLIWWDPEAGVPQHTVFAHDGWVRDLAATPDGTRLVSVGDDMLVKLWDAETGELVRSISGHAQQTPQGHVTALYVVTVSPDGKHLASGDRIGEVRVWETDSGKLAQSFQVPILYTYDPKQRKRSIGGIRSLAFSPDGKRLAVGGIGQVGNVDGLAGPVHVELWEWEKPQQLFATGAEGHKAIINHLQFHPSGTWLVGAGGGSDDGIIAFWKTEPTVTQKKDGASDAKEDGKNSVPAHRVKTDGHIHRFCFSPSCTELYAAGHGKVEFWK
jgi:WD40 repeat protein